MLDILDATFQSDVDIAMSKGKSSSQVCTGFIDTFKDNQL